MLDIQVTGMGEKKLMVLVAGSAGAGKTPFAATFPKPFWAASKDAGLLSIQNKTVPYHELKSKADMDEIIAACRQPAEIREQYLGQPVETLVIDTLDGFQKILKKERQGANGKFSQPDYGWLRDTMRSYCDAWFSLPVNVVALVHLSSDKDEELGKIYYDLRLEGAARGETKDMFDIIGLLEARTTSTVVGQKVEKVVSRVLRLTPDANVDWLRDRSHSLPSEFPVNLADDYTRMAALVYKDWDKRKAEADAKEEAALEEIKNNMLEIIGDEIPEAPQEVPESRVEADVEVITPQEFKALTEPFTTIEDEAKRKQVKDEFVAEFGNPRVLPATRLDDAVAWVTEHTQVTSDPEPEPEPDYPACVECGETITDDAQAELSLLQTGFVLCETDLDKKNK